MTFISFLLSEKQTKVSGERKDKNIILFEIQNSIRARKQRKIYNNLQTLHLLLEWINIDQVIEILHWLLNVYSKILAYMWFDKILS